MKLTAFVGRLFVVIAILASLYALGWSLTNVGTILRVIFIAALAAYLVNPIVKRLQGRGMAREMAIASVFLGFITFLALAVYLVLPVARQQLVQIGSQIEGFSDSRDEHVARLQVVLEEKLPGDMMKDVDLKDRIDTGMTKLSARR